MKYVQLMDGSVFVTRIGDANLTRMITQTRENCMNNRNYDPVDVIGRLIAHYIPNVLEKNPGIHLNQSGVTLEMDEGIWLEEELEHIKKKNKTEKVLFQFLVECQVKGHFYSTVSVFNPNQNVLHYIDPTGRPIPAKALKIFKKVLPDIKIKCFKVQQINRYDEIGPITIDNAVKVSQNQKVFNPTDFASPEQKGCSKSRRQIISDYVLGLKKNHNQILKTGQSATSESITSSTMEFRPDKDL